MFTIYCAALARGIFRKVHALAKNDPNYFSPCAAKNSARLSKVEGWAIRPECTETVECAQKQP